MIRINRLQLILLVWLWGISSFSQSESHNVGVAYLEFPFLSQTNESQKQTIKGLIWYPTQAHTQQIRFGPYTVQATRDAKIKTGSYKLAVISHGSGGSHMGHRDTAMYLAQRDYVVVTVLHPENNYLDNSAEGKIRNWENRPKHISATLDYVLAESPFGQFINEGKVAVLGHSAGGYTALALMGGLPDTSNIYRHCATQYDATICDLNAFTRFLARYTRLGQPDSNILNDLVDTRVSAAVLMAPVGVLFSNPNALSAVKKPLLIYRAEKDRILKYPYQAEYLHKNLKHPHQYVSVEGAGHFSFITPFPETIKDEIGEPALDPDGFDREVFHEKMNEEIYGFLNANM